MRFVWLLACAMCAALLAWSMPAIAADGACSESATRWAREASAALPFTVRLEACFAAQKVILDVADTESLPVEIAIGPGPAFRTAGALRVSPILEVPDFSAVAAPRRNAFELLVAWLAAHESQVVASFQQDAPLTAPAVSGSHPVPWIAIAGFVLAIAGGILRARRRPRDSAVPRADLAVVSAAFLIALAARLAFGPWGPLHPNGQGALWILRLTAPTDGLPLYGSGYRELFHGLAMLGGTAPDTVVFAANAVLSAACVPLAFVLARLSGMETPRAAVVPAALVLDGVAIRTAATEGYFSSILFFALCASALLQAAVHSWQGRSRAAAVLWALAAGLCATQAARIHPGAWPLVALAPLAAFTAARSKPLRKLVALAAGCAIFAAVAALTSGGALLAAVRFARAHPTVVDTPFTMSWLKLALAALAAIGIAMLARPRAVALPWIAHVAVLLGPLYTGQHPSWRGACEGLFVVWAWVGIAAVVPERLASRRWWWLVPPAIAAAVCVAGLRLVRDRTTDHEEYHFTRHWLAELPAGCRVVYLHRAGLRVAALPEFMAPDEARPRFARVATGKGPVRWPAFDTSACVYYYRSTLCSLQEGRDACEEAARSYVLEEQSTMVMPERTDFFGVRRAAGQVQLGVYRIVGDRRR